MKYYCDFCNGIFHDLVSFIQHLTYIERRRSKAHLSEINQLIKELQSPAGQTAKSPTKISTTKPPNPSKAVPTQIDFSIPAIIRSPTTKDQASLHQTTSNQNPSNENLSKKIQPNAPEPSNDQPSAQSIQPKIANFDKPVRHLDFSLPEEFPPNGIAEDPTKNKVRLIVPEDWKPYLEWKSGGRPEAYRFVSSCLYRKIEGDMVLLDKIYLEGRPPEYYPFKCLNPKTLEFSYRGANQKWNKSTKNLYNLLRGNIQDIYIRYQNQGIADQMKRNSGQDGDKVLSGHDYGYWQAHISESYTNPNYQKNFLKALAELLQERHEEYKENNGSMCRGEPSGSDMYLPPIFINKPPPY